MILLLEQIVEELKKRRLAVIIKETGISRQYLSMIKNNRRRKPRYNVLHKLSTYLIDQGVKPYPFALHSQKDLQNLLKYCINQTSKKSVETLSQEIGVSARTIWRILEDENYNLRYDCLKLLSLYFKGWDTDGFGELPGRREAVDTPGKATSN